MKNRHILRFFSLLLAIASLICSCGKGGDSDSTTSTTGGGTAEAQITPADDPEPEGGLFAEYYNGKNFEEFIRSDRVESAQLSFKSGESPAEGVLPEGYSIRLSGQIKSSAAGKYVFTTEADDGVRLYISGKEIINDPGPHTKKTSTGSVELEADSLYDLVIEYYNGELGGELSLSWEVAGNKKEAVPSSSLFLPKKAARAEILPGDQGQLIFSGALFREGYGECNLVIDRYFGGAKVDSVTVKGESPGVIRHMIKPETEEEKMSEYRAYVTGSDNKAISEVATRRAGEDKRVIVDITKNEGKVSNLLYGSCMEDVNHELYGGIWSQMIFGESFEEAGILDPGSGFTSAGGSWFDSDGAISVNNTPNGPKLIFGGSGCESGYIEAEINYSGEGAGFITKVSSAREGADNFYGYEIALFNGIVRTAKHRNNYQNIADTKADSAPGRWIKLRAEFDKNSLTVYVDGNQVYTYTDSDPLTSGEIGLRVWNASAKYRNIEICADGEVKKIDPAALSGAGSVSGMWRGEIKDAEGGFALTTDSPLSGRQSQLIEMISGSGSVSVNNMGLNRSGMNFIKDKDYRGYIYARSDKPIKVTATLESADGSKVYAEKEFTVNGLEFSKYSFELTANADDVRGRFAIRLSEPGKVELGYAFLETGEWGLYKGLHMRKDVCERLENQGITVMRFGGCMANAAEYKWKYMTGAPEFRGSYPGWWYGTSSYGYGIFEFLQLCEALGIAAAPDFSSYESASDMADFIDFACGTDKSNKWVALRHEMGHPEPFKLEYIQIGNEDKVDITFANRFNKIANAVWDKHPDVILVVGDFEYKNEITNPDRITGATSGITNLKGQKSILENAAKKGRPVWFDVHFWSQSGIEPYDLMNISLSFYNGLKAVCPDADTALCVFELNADSHDFERALCNAFATAFAERHSDIIRIMCSANALQVQDHNDNGWNQGLVFMDNRSTWYQPPAYIDRIFSDAYLPLLTGVSGDDLHTAKLDITCTGSEDGGTVCVKILNRTGSKKGIAIEIPGYAESGASLVKVVYSDLLKSVNTKNKPDNSKPSDPVKTENALENGSTLISVDKYSVTVLTFTKNK